MSCTAQKGALGNESPEPARHCCSSPPPLPRAPNRPVPAGSKRSGAAHVEHGHVLFFQGHLEKKNTSAQTSLLKKQIAVLHTHVCLQPLAEEPRAMPAQGEDACLHSCSLPGARYSKLNPQSKTFTGKGFPSITSNHLLT